MIHMYNHGGSENHGCEAIVRSTAHMLGTSPVLFSQNPDQDKKYHVDEVCEIRVDNNEQLRHGSFLWFLAALQTKFTGKIDLLIRAWKKEMLNQIRKGDVCLSVGGDNYCYAGTDILAATNKNLREKGAKTVLWGCSVEPELLKTPAIRNDIAAFDLITARESISYEALKKVNPRTVQVADPAFLLERKDAPLPEGWKEGNMIGINASPLILQSGDSQLVLDAYRQLIRYILDTTECSVALIPHVVCAGNDDRTVLECLYKEFCGTGKVVMVEDHNCMELKGYIARCRVFVGARTHATIAAYSSCVPTLVLGYSVKSRGIAKDLFGTEENYVIPVQSLCDENSLARGFAWILAHEENIKQQLQSVIPAYKEKAAAAAEALRNLAE